MPYRCCFRLQQDDAGGLTALHLAVMFGRHDIVSDLLGSFDLAAINSCGSGVGGNGGCSLQVLQVQVLEDVGIDGTEVRCCLLAGPDRKSHPWVQARSVEAVPTPWEDDGRGSPWKWLHWPQTAIPRWQQGAFSQGWSGATAILDPREKKKNMSESTDLSKENFVLTA